MSWYEWSEKRRTVLVGAMSLIGFLALLVCARRNIISLDSFWHLRMGMDWVSNGLSPWVDHYSFTFAGQEISSPPVLFQVTLYSLVDWFGLEMGYELMKLVSFSLVLGLLLVYLRQVRAPVFVYLIVIPTVIALIELRAMVRPELIPYSLSIVALILYYRAKGEVSARTVVPIALLMWFWSNYHTPVIGYVIFFGFFIDAGIRQILTRAPTAIWLRWLAWGLTVVAVGALRPGLSHPLYEMLLFSPEWRWLIQEFESPMLYRGVAAVYTLMAITIVTAIFSIRDRRPGYLAILGALIFGASTMARLVTPAGIVVACMFAHVMSEADWRGRLERSGTLMRSVFGLAFLTLVATSLWTTVSMARDIMEENRRSSALFPHDVVHHMKKTGRKGNIFNAYHMGGFLIYELSPESKVYIDGRTGILYPIDHYKRFKLAEVSPSALREETERYDISLALLENDTSAFFLMDEVGGFGLDFMGGYYSLFATDNPLFQSFGHLVARPACWSDEMAPQLNVEAFNAASHLPQDSALWPFLNTVMQYVTAQNWNEFLKGFAENGGRDDNVYRFAAYRAIDNGAWETAIRMLASIRDKQLKDYLAAAHAMIQTDALDTAEWALKVASDTMWPYVELPDIVILSGLITRLKTERPVTMLEEGFMRYVADQMADAGLAGRHYGVTTSLFCAGQGWKDEF